MTDQQLSRKPGDAPGLAGKYLTFALQHESFGIDVLQVREIIRHAILGIAKVKGAVKTLLDIDGVVGADQTQPILANA